MGLSSSRTTRLGTSGSQWPFVRSLPRLLAREPPHSAISHMASGLEQTRKSNLVLPSPRSDIPLHLLYFSHCKWVAVVLHAQGDGFPQGLNNIRWASLQVISEIRSTQQAGRSDALQWWLLWAGI